MQKLLLAALVLAVLVPTAQAQLPAPTLTVTINDLPASSLSNETQLAIPFTFTLGVGGSTPCLALTGSSTFTVALKAELVNSTGASTTVNVSPSAHTFAGPTLLPIGGSGSRTADAVVLVNAGPYAGDSLNATVKVTATATGNVGACTAMSNPSAVTAEASTDANFEPVQGFGEAVDNSQKMPAFGAPLLLVALAALVVLVRRN